MHNLGNTALTRDDLPPLSLYVHIPWCIKKCPYCDFNSHTSDSPLPIAEYLACLKQDLLHDAPLAQGRKIHSIFFGGGTPSLFPSWALKDLLLYTERLFGFKKSIEITLEANPGTIEFDSFDSILDAGVNRVSLGVQTFNAQQLKKLGRIHNASEATRAFHLARKAGFKNINIDLMHGLPEQSLTQGLDDIQQAISLKPEHISWYQLTVEPNTVFFNATPILPEEGTLGDIHTQGHALLKQAGFHQYETSAYAFGEKTSQHNMNYWQFGDYLAIGAGAHGKITLAHAHSGGASAFNQHTSIMRYQKTRQPNHYLDASSAAAPQTNAELSLDPYDRLKNCFKNNSFTSQHSNIAIEERAVEFMMNALRLIDGVDASLFEARTGLTLCSIQKTCDSLMHKNLLEKITGRITTTSYGHRYLNSVLEAFM